MYHRVGGFCGALQHKSLHEISLRSEGDQPVDLTHSVANIFECESLDSGAEPSYSFKCSICVHQFYSLVFKIPIAGHLIFLSGDFFMTVDALMAL